MGKFLERRWAWASNKWTGPRVQRKRESYTWESRDAECLLEFNHLMVVASGMHHVIKILQ